MHQKVIRNDVRRFRCSATCAWQLSRRRTQRGGHLLPSCRARSAFSLQQILPSIRLEVWLVAVSPLPRSHVWSNG